MSSEKNDFLTLLEKAIDYDLNLGDFNTVHTYWNLPGLLIKQGNNFYNLIVANKYSIQVIFGDSCLNDYLRSTENHDINNLNGK